MVMDEAREAARARARDVIARANLTLAEPRPETTGDEPWQRPRKQSPAPASVETVEPAARGAHLAAGAITRVAFERRMDSMEQAIGRLLGAKENAGRIRFAEAERRIADLEARLAALEGR